MSEIAIELLIYLTSTLSMIGSAYIVYKITRQPPQTAQQLLAYLSLGDMIFSVANILYVQPGQDPHQFRCNIQALIRQTCVLSTFLSSFFLSFCIYISVIKGKEISGRLVNYFVLFCFALPLLVSLIPILTRSYGSNIYACGIRQTNNLNEPFDILEGIFLFYVPIWILATFTVILTTKVVIFFHRVERDLAPSQHQIQLSHSAKLEKSQFQISYQITLTTLLYPLIQIACWTPQTIYRISLIFNSELLSIRGLSFIACDSQGIFNALIFIWSSWYFGQKNKIEDSLSRSSSVSLDDGLLF